MHCLPILIRREGLVEQHIARHSYRRDMPATAHPIQISMTIPSRLPRGAMAIEMRDMPATAQGSSIVNYHSAAKGLKIALEIFYIINLEVKQRENSIMINTHNYVITAFF